MPQLDPDVVERRAAGHAEYRRCYLTQRRLLDSLVGGQVYRDARYGSDVYGLPVYNLVRHKRERPNPRSRKRRDPIPSATYIDLALPADIKSAYSQVEPEHDQAANAGVDDFELRRARTPVPEIMTDIIGEHIARITRHEITRTGPAELERFWGDVDGLGHSIEQFVKSEVGPTYFACGRIDLLFDRPVVAGDPVVVSKADEVRLGLDRVHVTPILPENMLWWRLDARGKDYAEVLYREWGEDELGNPVEQFRHWDAESTSLYDSKYQLVPGTLLGHPYGACPVKCVMDGRVPGTRRMPKSAYEGVSERMREVYNLMSEVVLSDTLQAHPILCLPQEWCQENAEVPVGPNFVLPIKIVDDGTSKLAIPPMILDIPKGPTDSLRTSIAGHLAMAYWSAGLEPPSPVSDSVDRQSGISKELDVEKLNGILVERAKALQALETAIVEGWKLVTRTPDAEAAVHYPSKFGSFSAATLTGLFVAFQASYPAVGALPENDKAVLRLIVREIDPGRPDDEYKVRDREIDEFVDKQAKQFQAQSEAKLALAVAQKDNPIPSPAGGVPGGGPPKHVPEGAGQPERTGVNGTPDGQAKKSGKGSRAKKKPAAEAPKK